MDLGPEEKFLKFWEVSRNRALKRFAQFFVQPAANGLRSVGAVPTSMLNQTTLGVIVLILLPRQKL